MDLSDKIKMIILKTLKFWEKEDICETFTLLIDPEDEKQIGGFIVIRNPIETFECGDFAAIKTNKDFRICHKIENMLHPKLDIDKKYDNCYLVIISGFNQKRGEVLARYPGSLSRFKISTDILKKKIKAGDDKYFFYDEEPIKKMSKRTKKLIITLATISIIGLGGTINPTIIKSINPMWYEIINTYISTNNSMALLFALGIIWSIYLYLEEIRFDERLKKDINEFRRVSKTRT